MALEEDDGGMGFGGRKVFREKLRREVKRREVGKSGVVGEIVE